MKIYLDYAAATPLDPEVKKVMSKYLDEEFYNPSSSYLAAQNVKVALNDARRSTAFWLGAKPNEVIFTAGATESDNLAIRGVLEQFPGSNAIISAIEHDAVRAPAQLYEHQTLGVDGQGIIKIAELEKQVNDQTSLVSIIYANNEIGTIQPLAQVAQIIEKVRIHRRKEGNDLPIYFHTDAVQAANYLDIHVSRLGVDLLTLSAAKIYGPKQVGILYVKSGTMLSPLIVGGGQEKSLRSGTENVAGAIAIAKALDKAQGSRKDEAKTQKTLRDTLMANLLNMPKAAVNGSMKKRLPNNLNIRFNGIDGERLIMELDELGVMVSAGAACEASDDEPSHVLMALGLDASEAQSSLRISLGRHTTKEQIAIASKTIVDSVSLLRQN